VRCMLPFFFYFAILWELHPLIQCAVECAHLPVSGTLRCQPAH